MILKALIIIFILIYKDIHSQEWGHIHLKNGEIKEGIIQILKPFGSTTTLVEDEFVRWEDIEKIKIDNKEILPKVVEYNGFNYKSYFMDSKFIFYGRKQFGKNNFSLKKIEILSK